MNAITEAAVGTQVHRAWIKAEPEAIFKALTDPEQIVRYGYAAPVEIEPLRHGVSRVTVTHELDGAPLAAAIVGGSVVEAGGGWAFILSDLKSLLETGSAMPSQMG